MSITLYGVLGVDRSATEDELKEAYLSLAREHHPDRGGDTERMAEITGAYAQLKSKQRREFYDGQLELIGTKCNDCDGAGRKWKQKGFTARVATRCKACNGEGFTAVKSVKLVTLSESTKKRRVKK